MSDSVNEQWAKTPWAYRPDEFDDWGVIRTTHPVGDHCPVVAVVRVHGSEEELNEHRRNRTDPAAAVGNLIVAAVNTYRPDEEVGEAGTGMVERCFYRTRVSIDVLSEGPLPRDMDLPELHRAISEGPCVGGSVEFVMRKISPKEAAAALSAFGSDPSFFDLDADGNSLADREANETVDDAD